MEFRRRHEKVCLYHNCILYQKEIEKKCFLFFNHTSHQQMGLKNFFDLGVYFTCQKCIISRQYLIA